MARVGFEPMIPEFERPKAVRALDRAVIGTGSFVIMTLQNCTDYVGALSNGTREQLWINLSEFLEVWSSALPNV